VKPVAASAWPVVGVGLGLMLLVVVTAAVLSGGSRQASAPVVDRREPARPPAPPPAPAPAPSPVVPAATPPPPSPSEPDLDRWIREIRTLEADDPGFRRAEELRSMLKRLAEIAGQRRAEIDALASAYETRIRAASEASPPPPSSDAEPEITEFVLVKAETGEPIPGFDPLRDGARFSLDALGTRHLSIQAKTRGPVGCVRFEFEGNPNYQLERAAPYSMKGDLSGKPKPWMAGPGTYELKAVPYRTGNASGKKGKELKVGFTVLP
jgi:hypothetical protein